MCASQITSSLSVPTQDDMQTMTTARLTFFAALTAVAVLSACTADQKPATQVAVKVNKDEISVHQVNAQLGRLGGIPTEKREEVKKQVVDGLVNQQLLVQQALQKKLDRDPEVLTAIEASRQQILAQAYVQKALSASARPSEAEVSRYYAENPGLFSERRIFRLQELATSFPVSRAEELNALAGRSKSIAELAAWLRKEGFEVAGNSAVRASEQLPMASVARVATMKDGDIGVFTNDNRVTVLQIVQSQPQPMSEKDAAQFIEQFLGNQKREEATRAELKRLRDAAAIEYVGEFSTGASGADTAATAAKPAAAAAEAAAKSVDKGVTGLR
jgi:EpsD family peptidyl-prolyl cis-trans isomerase